MGISLDSLSITSAFNSILNFFKSQENNSKWKDLSTGSEGIFLIRMLANILSNISYRLVTARRENYITTANLLSSALGIALNLGYSAHRGTNQKRKIQFEANSDYVIPSHTVIGSYDGTYDVIYVGDLDPETHLRKGLILEGPLELGTIKNVDSLTRTIVVGADISTDINVGELVEIVSAGLANGRYTIASINTKVINGVTHTYLMTKEAINGSYVNGGNENATITKIPMQEFKVVIGKLKSISWTAGTSKVQPFTRFEEGISEDYILYLDSREVPTSNIVRDLKEDMYLVRTNPYSSIDVLYLNNIATGQYKYGSESVFTLKYIELADVETKELDEHMSGYGKVQSTITISQFTPFEKIEDVKINGPVDHEVQHLIRSKKDYTRRVKQLLPNIVETSYEALTPTYTIITYLKDDCTTLENTEIEKVKSILTNENYFGTPLPDIAHPSREAVNITIKVFITNKLIDSNDIRYDIDNIIKSNYAKYLKQTFDTYTLERLIEQLSYVKWARVTIDASEWTPRGTIDLGDIIKVDNTYYKASKVLGYSGGVDPNWNIPLDNKPLGIDLDAVYETKDGNVIWRTYKRLDVVDIKEYKTGTQYGIGDYVYVPSFPNFMFKCIDLLKSSGSNFIDTTATEKGDFIVDGELVWVCKEYNNSYGNRTVATQYRLGSSANMGTKSFEVIGYIGKTGYTPPVFEQAYYPISNRIVPQQVIDLTLAPYGYFEIKGDQTEYFRVGSMMHAYKDKDTDEQAQEFKVLSRSTDGDTTKVYVTTSIGDYIKSENILSYGPMGSGSYSMFTVAGDKTSMFKVGDNIKALGDTVDNNYTVLTLSYGFNVIQVRTVVNEEGTGANTEVMVKGRLQPEVNYHTLIEASYTRLSCDPSLNNSFCVIGDVSGFFNSGSIIKTKTDEDVEMTYSVVSTEYNSIYNTTYIKVAQTVSSNANYQKIAPAWQGTSDGEIRWDILENKDNISYGWDVYNDIKSKIMLQY